MQGWGHHHHHHGGGIGLGDALMGAAILGTAAAVASSNHSTSSGYVVRPSQPQVIVQQVPVPVQVQVPVPVAYPQQVMTAPYVAPPPMAAPYVPMAQPYPTAPQPYPSSVGPSAPMLPSTAPYPPQQQQPALSLVPGYQGQPPSAFTPDNRPLFAILQR